MILVESLELKLNLIEVKEVKEVIEVNDDTQSTAKHSSSVAISSCLASLRMTQTSITSESQIKNHSKL